MQVSSELEKTLKKLVEYLRILEEMALIRTILREVVRQHFGADSGPMVDSSSGQLLFGDGRSQSISYQTARTDLLTLSELGLLTQYKRGNALQILTFYLAWLA